MPVLSGTRSWTHAQATDPGLPGYELSSNPAIEHALFFKSDHELQVETMSNGGLPDSRQQSTTVYPICTVPFQTPVEYLSRDRLGADGFIDLE